MNVDYVVRRDIDRRGGGDLVQAQRMADELRSIGVEAEVRQEPSAHGDLIHAFNTTRLASSWHAFGVARARGVPFVLTPIWHSLEDMATFYGRRLGRRAGRFPIVGYLAAKEPMYERSPRAFVLPDRFRDRVRRLVDECDALVVNSEQELDTLRREIGCDPRGIVAFVPNGADLGAAGPAADGRKPERERVVICAARIEPRKNQLALCEAFLRSDLATDHELHLAGATNDRHRNYAAAVRAQCDGRRIRWLGELPRDDVQRRFARARVVALPSYFETTGLVALEGLFQGAQVVQTTRVYGEDYFEGWVHDCDPYSVASIRDALNAAERTPCAPPPPAYFERFAWSTVARATADVYAQLTSTR